VEQADGAAAAAGAPRRAKEINSLSIDNLNLPDRGQVKSS
jgi:hypothetical protein